MTHWPQPRSFLEAWCTRLLLQLHSQGINHFCIAPGSRSAPLTLAIERLSKASPNIRIHSHFDERGLGYFALGVSKASQSPVVIITTSGTAVANLLPSVVEAFQTGAPLILLTADRPEELINCGANQAIEQPGIFSHFVNATLNLTTPDVNSNIDMLDNQLLSLISQIHSGPIHINCPFREPLYPSITSKQDTDYSSWLEISSNQIRLLVESGLALADEKPHQQINLNQNTLICIGDVSSEEATALLTWATTQNLPVLADISSGLRLFKHPNCLPYAELVLATKEGKKWFSQFNQVIQFGGHLVGKRINQFLVQFNGEYLIISPEERYLDPGHKAKQFCQNITDFTEQKFISGPKKKQNSLDDISILIARIEQHIDATFSDSFSEINLVRTLTDSLAENTNLFAGNSLPIRWLEIFGKQTSSNTTIFSNRGASGIDGLVATSSGIATLSDSTVLLIGDTSLLHDLNSLDLANKIDKTLVIVVINNSGGSIFNLLPASEFPETNQRLFRLEHQLAFKQAARQFGIDYYQAGSIQQFTKVFSQKMAQPKTALIECSFPSNEATDRFQKFISTLIESDSGANDSN